MARIFFLGLFFPLAIYALPAQESYPFKTAAEQHRFQQLTQQFRCLVCQNQSLADSNAPLAQDLRHQIFILITAQKSNQEINQYLIQRYGEFVSYQPAFKPSTVILWVLPALILLGGLFFVWRLCR